MERLRLLLRVEDMEDRRLYKFGRRTKGKSETEKEMLRRSWSLIDSCFIHASYVHLTGVNTIMCDAK